MAAQRSRDLRWWALRALEKVYPGDLSERTIALTLAGISYTVSPGELSTHLAYLEEKGYVERRHLKSRELNEERDVARLTAKGKDLLEGNIAADPGIDSAGPLD